MNKHSDYALYVQKTYQETDWKCTKVCIYLNKLERYKFKMAKGLQRYLPNEHSDHEEIDFLTSSFED